MGNPCFLGDQKVAAGVGPGVKMHCAASEGIWQTHFVVRDHGLLQYLVGGAGVEPDAAGPVCSQIPVMQ